VDGAIFPPEIAAPMVRWDGAPAKGWTVQVTFRDGSAPIVATTGDSFWRISDAQWEEIKRHSVSNPATIAVTSMDRDAPSAARVEMRTSEAPVGAPLFFREVIIPFAEAVKDPSRILWRFGDVGARSPPAAVLGNLPVCGNCHSFSRDGSVLGMDVDYANDKGSYSIAPVAAEIALTRDRIMTWSDYRRGDGELTFGLLSQVSPDGRYVVSTVKDRSIFMCKDDIGFSQLFFPIKGILVVYDRQTRSFKPLPGADDRKFVQSNPSWSPDGKWIMFARAPAEDLGNLKHPESALLTESEAAEFFARRPRYRYDICRVPFNDGAGGAPEAVEGASGDDFSNFFARYSPDGRWIVFCKARNYMLLQPDSELYILPSAGGKARRMACNTGRMNSWHSWSPDGRWLVFASKANGPFTQLWLTRVDGNGLDSPAVCLERLTAPDRAANIPEFVNIPAGAISRIREEFMDDMSFVRAGTDRFNVGDLDAAERSFRRAVEHNPSNAVAHFCIGNILAMRGRAGDAVGHFAKAEESDPTQHAYPLCRGKALRDLGRNEESVASLRRAIALTNANAEAHAELGRALYSLGRSAEAVESLARAVALAPDDVPARYSLSMALFKVGRTADAAAEARRGADAAGAAGRQDQEKEIRAALDAMLRSSARPR
jgi:tetratricopeptide (TPR) repeat protein